MSRRPHIVFDALQVRGRVTGVAQASMEYLSELARDDRGFRFTVLVSDHKSFGFLAKREHWQTLVCSQADEGIVQKSIFTQWRLPRLLREIEADLLHSLQFVTPLSCPCPVVATVHDMAWRLHRETIEQPRRTYYRLMVPRCLHKAAAVFTNSESTAQDVRRCLPGLAAEIITTPFGTPTWLAQESGEEQTNSDDPYFLFVGTLEPRKNLARLLKAYADLLSVMKRDHETVKIPRLVLAGGEGWQMAELKAILEGFEGRDHVKWCGYQSPADLARLYRGALALVYPSLYEGFGFPILEAMSLGLPVVTSARGAMAEVAGEAAVLVDPLNISEISSALLKLATDANWRNTWSQKGGERSAEWTWKRTVAASLPIYRHLAP
ncbi:MAG: glycosyltransferase involved in cell wall biosynthesis [Candidatus Krumholzibacteriia bacterium]|jgi:glycosyltransferase involved in cell wall biosynthesis